MLSADSSTQAKSSAGGTKRKISPYNKFVKEELARLKESHPDLTHKERWVFLACTGSISVADACLVGSKWLLKTGRPINSELFNTYTCSRFPFYADNSFILTHDIVLSYHYTTNSYILGRSSLLSFLLSQSVFCCRDYNRKIACHLCLF